VLRQQTARNKSRVRATLSVSLKSLDGKAERSYNQTHTVGFRNCSRAGGRLQGRGLESRLSLRERRPWRAVNGYWISAQFLTPDVVFSMNGHLSAFVVWLAIAGMAFPVPPPCFCQACGCQPAARSGDEEPTPCCCEEHGAAPVEVAKLLPDCGTAACGEVPGGARRGGCHADTYGCENCASHNHQPPPATRELRSGDGQWSERLSCDGTPITICLPAVTGITSWFLVDWQRARQQVISPPIHLLYCVWII